MCLCEVIEYCSVGFRGPGAGKVLGKVEKVAYRHTSPRGETMLHSHFAVVVFNEVLEVLFVKCMKTDCMSY